MAVVAVVAYFGWSARRPAAPDITISGIRQLTRAPELELFPAISPDGNDVVYASGAGGGPLHLYIQDAGGGRALPLTADQPGIQMYPQWTADGRAIVYTDDTPEGTRARRIPRLGGPVQNLLDLRYRPLGYLSAIEWAYYGDRLAFARGDSLFIRGPDAGDVFLARIASFNHSLVWSPDGRLLAWVEGNPQWVYSGTFGSVAPSTIRTITVAGGDPVDVITGGSLNVSPVWTPDSRHLLFISDRDGPRGVYAIGVDDHGRPDGDPVVVAAGLDAHSLSISADGHTLAFSKFTFRRNIMRVEVPAAGPVSITKATPVTRGNQIVEGVAVSRDGRWLAYDTNIGGNQDIWVMPAEGGEPRQLTTDPAGDYAPDFSPDGREIAFHSLRAGTRDIFVMPVEGGSATRLTDDPGDEYMPKFSPDGRHIVYYRVAGGTSSLYLLSRNAVGEPWGTVRLLIRRASAPAWSPDGGRIAYVSGADPGGLAVIAPDGQGQEIVDLPAGLRLGWVDGWSPDGRSIRFRALQENGASELFEIDVGGGPVRKLVRFDDPRTALWRSTAARQGNRLYLSVGQYDSDIYLADLAIK